MDGRDTVPICEEAEEIATVSGFSDAQFDEAIPIGFAANSSKAIQRENDRKERKQLVTISITTVVICIVFLIALIIQWGLNVVEIYPHGVVVASSQTCADVGLDLLKKGGSAVDAAVGAAFCNGVVNFASSGIGGGGFLLIHDHKAGKVNQSISFNVRAPLSMVPGNFSSRQQVLSGPLSIGTPGELTGLFEAHVKHGQLSWHDVVSPSVILAHTGFSIGEDSKKMLESLKLSQNLSESVRGFVLDANGNVKDTYTRHLYANALELIRDQGLSPLQGELADDILATIGSAGLISKTDFVEYTTYTAKPLSVPFHGHVVLSAGAPSAGPAILHTLSLLSQLQAGDSPTEDGGYKFSSQDYHMLIEALKFGVAATAELGDPSNSAVSSAVLELLNSTLNSDISMRILSNSTLPLAEYGPLPDADIRDPSLYPSVNYVTAIDKDELTVSLVSSNGSPLGSQIITKKYGIILNNKMADFAFPGSTGNAANQANVMRGGAMPLCLASAPLIFHSEEIKCRPRGGLAASNMPGGRPADSLAGSVQMLMNLLYANMKPETALSSPRVSVSEDLNHVFVEDTLDAQAVPDLEAAGHNVTRLPSAFNSVSSAGRNNSSPMVMADTHRSDARGANY